MRVKFALLIAMLEFTAALTQGAQPNGSLFTARCKAGERMIYIMKGLNQKWRYQIQASGVVRRDSKGNCVVEYAWSHLVSNRPAMALPASAAWFRQVVSLDQGRPPLLPNLHTVPPVLIGPITDLDTFYVDLWLAMRLGNKLDHAGDHANLKLGIPASWADGKRVLIGESAVDFDFTLLNLDQAAGFAMLLVRHVPPAQPRVPLPAPWMRNLLLGPPPNWVTVAKRDGQFVACVGHETFDVRTKVSLVDGKILSASMQNLVQGQERHCGDAALTRCGTPYPIEISRHISISLERYGSAIKPPPSRIHREFHRSTGHRALWCVGRVVCHHLQSEAAPMSPLNCRFAPPPHWQLLNEIGLDLPIACLARGSALYLFLLCTLMVREGSS
jgi:hypothetical protein